MPNPNAKPPKRRKAHGRKVKGGNKKRTSYNYPSAREAMDMPTANHAQIFQHATIQHATEMGHTPPNQKSPLKSVYKSMLKQQVSQIIESLRQQKMELQVGLDHKDQKISSQKQRINELASLLQDEKRKSRAVIEKLMMEADAVIAEANDISMESTSKVAAVRVSLDSSKQRNKEAVQKERQYNYQQVASCKLFCITYM